MLLDTISIQLYSVRDETEKDMKGTLKTLAKMGYNGVEFAGYRDIPAKEMKACLDENGLICTGSHLGYDVILDHLEAELEYNHILNNKYIICAWSDMKSADDAKRIAEGMEKAGEICAKNGFVLAYHNHNHEFGTENGKYFLDIFYENTSPEYVKAQLDIFWVTKGGEDALSYVKKYAGRLPLVHLKDMAADGENCDVGAGHVMDIPKIITAAKEGGTEYFAVELEKYKISPLDSAKASCDYLKTL